MALSSLTPNEEISVEKRVGLLWRILSTMYGQLSTCSSGCVKVDDRNTCEKTRSIVQSSLKQTEKISLERKVGPLSGILSMNKGVGPDSYAKNSTLANEFTERLLHILDKTLRGMTLPATGPIVIADLGCSSSQNTIKNVSRVVEVLRERYLTSGQATPQFQAYFNDLPSTDFNSLFQLLQLDSTARDFFAAGLPGSYFGPLFPVSSVHVFISTHTLHYLSQIPPEVEEKDSPSYNGERVWLHDSSAAVIEKFKQQGKTDLKNFFDARADELVVGGMLFCIFSGSSPNCGERDWLRPLSDDKSTTPMSLRRLMEYAWDELVSEGVLAREQRAGLNLPNYMFASADVKVVLENCSHLFKVERFDEIATNIGELPPLDRERWIDGLLKGTKAAYTPLFVAHLGNDLTSAFFSRLSKIASNVLTFDRCFRSFVLALIRI